MSLPVRSPPPPPTSRPLLQDNPARYSLNPPCKQPMKYATDTLAPTTTILQNNASSRTLENADDAVNSREGFPLGNPQIQGPVCVQAPGRQLEGLEDLSAG